MVCGLNGRDGPRAVGHAAGATRPDRGIALIPMGCHRVFLVRETPLLREAVTATYVQVFMNELKY